MNASLSILPNIRLLFCSATHEAQDIKNNAWVTVNNGFLVTSKVICRVTKSRVKIIGKSHHAFTVTNVLFHFLQAMLCPEHIIPLKTIIDRSFRHCRQGRSSLTSNCYVTRIDLWRNATPNYWHCDIIFLDCSCTRELAQRRSSLVNNNREYRFLTTRYSRLSV